MPEDKKNLRLEYGRKLKSFIRDTPAPVLREKERALTRNLFSFLDSSEFISFDSPPAAKAAPGLSVNQTDFPSAKGNIGGPRLKRRPLPPLIIGAYQPLPGEPSPRAFQERPSLKLNCSRSAAGPVSWEKAWGCLKREKAKEAAKLPPWQSSSGKMNDPAPPEFVPVRFAFPAVEDGALAFYLPLSSGESFGQRAAAPSIQGGEKLKKAGPKKTVFGEKGSRHGTAAYKKSPLSFLEPDPAKSRKIPLDSIRVFLLPGRAFDRQGARLGRGGGFYDRVLEGSRQLKIGLAWDIQIHIEDLPRESHDAAMDAIITESFVLIPKIKDMGKKLPRQIFFQKSPPSAVFREGTR